MKKTLSAIALFVGLGFSSTLSAQNYNEMPTNIQKKMDQNKSNGLPLSEGVQVDYELTIEGVTNETSANEFRSLLKKECGLISFRFDPTNNHVFFTLPAKYNLDGMVPVIKNSKYSMGLFFKEFYHLQN